MKFNYRKIYNKYSDSELVNVISNSKNYEPESVKVAKEIINERKISEKKVEEIIISNRINLSKSSYDLKNDIKHYSNLIFHFLTKYFNPFQKKLTKSDKKIRLVFLMIFGLFIKNVYEKSSFIYWYYKSNDYGIDSETFILLLPLFVLPISLIFFYYRKAFGWYVLYSSIFLLILQEMRFLMSGILYSEVYSNCYACNIFAILFFIYNIILLRDTEVKLAFFKKE
jgi:uncharacterized membrane protein